MIVNGEPRAVDSGGPLLWALRDLGLRSVKYGCGAGQCGTCHVLVDGVPTASCQVDVADVGEREVTTLEGLAAAASVQHALVRHNAGQCGYCLPGIVVGLTHLARGGVTMTGAEIAAAMDDHLCRCGAYPRILRAALEVLGD